MWIDDDDFDENDMMAAIAAEQAEKADDDEFDEDDMMAAIAAEQAEKAGGAGDGVDFDEGDMMAAIQAEQAGKGGGGGGGGGVPAKSGSLGGDRLFGITSAVQDIGVDITAVLGTAEMKVSNLLKIGRGAVIELNKRVGDTVELQVAGRSVACGDVVVVEDKLAVSITETYKKNVSN